MKSNIFKCIFILSLSFLLVQCNQHSSQEANMVSLDEVAETSDMKSISNETGLPIANEKANILKNLKIIKNAQCRFKVSNVTNSTTEARKIIGAHGGYISDMRFQNSKHQLENRFTVRVPQQNFETILQELSALAEFVDFKNITSKDISEEYVDLQTRLKTKLDVKERYDAILRSKAKTVEEVLLAEEKLRVLQEEIEAAQGRLKFLSNKTAFSTIQIDLYETVAYKEKPKTFTKSFAVKAKQSLVFGWNLIVNLFLAILYIWPLVLITIGIISYLKFRKKK